MDNMHGVATMLFVIQLVVCTWSFPSSLFYLLLLRFLSSRPFFSDLLISDTEMVSLSRRQLSQAQVQSAGEIPGATVVRSRFTFSPAHLRGISPL